MKFEEPAGEYLKVLVYGANGVGKTVLASTAPPPVLILDAEAGLLSIRNRMGDDIKAVRITDFNELREIALELKLQEHNFRTVVLDSLTEIQYLSMREVMSKQKEKDVPAQRDWYVNIEEMRKVTRFFRDLPMNVVFTCLSKDEKDEQFGNIVRKPSLTGKLPEEVCGFVDLVLYEFTKDEDGEAVRYLLSQPTERIYAKDRSGKLERFEKPDLSAIHAKIFVQEKRRKTNGEEKRTNA